MTAEKTAIDRETCFGPLVDSAWLVRRLGDPRLRLYDASYYLPHEGQDARRLYEAVHIPGAAFFDVDAIADPTSGLPHMAPTTAEFARMAAELGLQNDSEVVFYDQRGLFSAARGWWLLRLFGHRNVTVLDGGLPGWLREGHPTRSGNELPPRGLRPFKPQLQPQLRRDLAAMRANLPGADARGQEIVLDARSLARFRGEAPEPRPGLRGGHIPGSACLPYQDLLTAHGTLLPTTLLRQRFAALGVGEHSPVVATCGSGVSATLIVLALAVAGYRDAALYDGAWAEWGGRSDTPVAAP